jgi:phage gp37-like protein
VIAVIEEAIKARIAEAALPYKPAIATYGGEFDEGLDQVVRRFPAVWVTFAHDGPGKPTSTSRDVWHIPATFVVLVGARNLRSEASTRQGDVRQVGTYRMIADVRRLLTNQDLGLPIDPFTPGRARTLVNANLKGQAVSAFALEWHTIYPLRLREPEIPEPPLLERVGLNYHLLPDDGVPDAADLVELKGDTP